MFPIRWNFPFRKKDGSLSTIQDEIDSGGGGGYTLPTASATTKGGVKVGDGLTMDGEVLKNTNPTPPTPYELPTASAETLGGVKVGSGLSINDGVLSVPGGATITKLWEKSGSGGQSADTTIELSSSNYDFLIVNAVYDNQSGHLKYETNQVMLKGHGTTLFMGWQAWVSNKTELHLASRTVEYVDDTHYKLSNGYQNGDSAGSALVTVIYGVKF